LGAPLLLQTRLGVWDRHGGNHRGPEEICSFSLLPAPPQHQHQPHSTSFSLLHLNHSPCSLGATLHCAPHCSPAPSRHQIPSAPEQSPERGAPQPPFHLCLHTPDTLRLTDSTFTGLDWGGGGVPPSLHYDDSPGFPRPPQGQGWAPTHSGSS
jgi:hypothetical protein